MTFEGDDVSEPITPPSAEQISAMMSLTQLLAETAAGYYKKLTEGDIAPDIAAQMTKDFHDLLLEQIREGQKKQQSPVIKRR